MFKRIRQMAPPGYFYDDVSRNTRELLTYFFGGI